jgi:hypothetical protein
MKIIATLKHRANPQAEIVIFDFREEYVDGEARSPMGILPNQMHQFMFGQTFILPLGGLVDASVYPFQVIGGGQISEAALVKHLITASYYDAFVDKPDEGQELFSVLDELTVGLVDR